VIRKTAKLRLYELTVHSSWLIDAPSPWRIDSSAVEMAVTSSATINDAIEHSTSTQRWLELILRVIVVVTAPPVWFWCLDEQTGPRGRIDR